jgi:hypothetical protein
MLVDMLSANVTESGKVFNVTTGAYEDI